VTDLKSFIGIGAQKAGTTSLADFLKAHPDVYMPAIKEMHFFDLVGQDSAALDKRITDDIRRRYLRMERALKATPVKQAEIARVVDEIRSIAERHDIGKDPAAYRAALAAHPPGQTPLISGEITPAYAVLGPRELLAIQNTLNRPKILFLLRNPVDRFLSQVGMLETKLARKTVAKADPRDYINKTRFLRRSRYEKTLQNLGKIFPPEDVFVRFFEDMYGPDAQEFHRQLCEFLEISPTPAAQITPGPIFSRKNTDPALRLMMVRKMARTYQVMAARPQPLPKCWQEDLDLL
jgi:sulfotransferase family protein